MDRGASAPSLTGSLRYCSASYWIASLLLRPLLDRFAAAPLRRVVVVGERSVCSAPKGRCRWIAERLLRSEGSFSFLPLPFSNDASQSQTGGRLPPLRRDKHLTDDQCGCPHIQRRFAILIILRSALPRQRRFAIRCGRGLSRPLRRD